MFVFLTNVREDSPDGCVAFKQLWSCGHWALNLEVIVIMCIGFLCIFSRTACVICSKDSFLSFLLFSLISAVLIHSFTARVFYNNIRAECNTSDIIRLSLQVDYFWMIKIEAE